MKEYLRMSDVFGVVGVKVREGNGRHVMCEDILAANCFCEDSAKYAANAIKSHDELVAKKKRMRDAMSGLLSLTEHFAECGGWDVNAYAEYKKAKGA